MTIKEAIDKILSRENMTKYRLAKILGTSQSTIQNWLDGRTEAPQFAYCKKIYDIYGLVVYFSEEELKNA